MELRDAMLGCFLALLVVSVLPLFEDPYIHRNKVDFWLWLKRELVELKEGEKE